MCLEYKRRDANYCVFYSFTQFDYISLTCCTSKVRITHSIRIWILTQIDIQDELTSSFIILFRTFAFSKEIIFEMKLPNYNLKSIVILPSYSGKQSTRCEYMIFSSSKSFLFKKRITEDCWNHGYVMIVLNNAFDSSIRF